MRSLFSRLFVSQEVLDRWGGEDLITLEGEEISLRPTGWRYRLTPALRVDACVSGDDPRDMVGRVRLESALRDAGGELYGGSLLLGEDAYEGAAGFLAERLPGPPGSGLGEPDPHEVEVLNKFLLEKL